jgi:hypothetical protein
VHVFKDLNDILAKSTALECRMLKARKALVGREEHSESCNRYGVAVVEAYPRSHSKPLSVTMKGNGSCYAIGGMLLEMH